MSAKPAFTYAQYLKSVGGVAGMSEAQFNEAFGITPDDVVLPLQIIPKRSVSSSIDTHVKIAAEVKERRRKKPESAKAKKEPKPKKDHVVQAHEMIKKPKKPRQSPEQKREWKRNYMKKWRKDNPKASYQHVKNWREKNPDKHRDYNRDWKRTRSKKSPDTTSTAQTSGMTTTTR